jgi:hypothetical protein
VTAVAAMQPYFFPYIGYFQMVDAVDRFVFLDDVQYIDRGWSNRNRILGQGAAQMITFPVRKASRDLLYREREYCIEEAERSVLKPIRYNYGRAPNFGAVMPLIESIMAFPSPNVAEFNANLIETIARYLRIDTQFVASSALDVDPALRGQSRILAICKAQGADLYVNASGGVELYDRAGFEAEGIELRFIAADLRPYRQLGHEPLVGLSIIDVLMFNSVDSIRTELWRSHWLDPA